MIGGATVFFLFIVDELEFGVDARDGFDALLALLAVIVAGDVVVGLFFINGEEAGLLVVTGLLAIMGLLGVRGLFVVSCLLILRSGVFVGLVDTMGEAVGV